MVYFGKVQNGKIIPEPGVRLKEGLRVRIEPAEAENAAAGTATPDPADNLGDEAVSTGITDLASEHDHYVYGLPKRGA